MYKKELLLHGKMENDEMARYNLYLLADNNDYTWACLQLIYRMYRQDYKPPDAYHHTLSKIAGVDPKI